MNQIKLTLLAAATVAAQLLLSSTGMAQPFYRANLETCTIATNQTGNLAYRSYGNRELIRDAAAQNGITNLSTLSVVYDQTADALEVVSGTNFTLISTPITFATGVALSNTNGVTQRFGGVYCGTNTTPSGTLVAQQGAVPATAHRAATYSLQGQLQFAVLSSGTNSPVIYLGNVSVGPDCIGLRRR